MLDPRIEAVRKKYDLSEDDFWQIPQNGQWVCRHAALEIVAVMSGVQFDPPIIIEKDAATLITSMVVVGRMGERSEWATGETNKTNYSVKGKQPAYPWAMSEKRAKDRVILKLVGIHGLVYSENEADFTKSKADSRDVFESLQDDLNACTTVTELGTWWRDKEVQGLVKTLPPDWKEIIIGKKNEMKNSLDKNPPAISPYETLTDQFPGDIPSDEATDAARNLSAG